MTRQEIHDTLDGVKFGDHITITRTNGGHLTSTVSGPALSAQDVSPAVGIDLLDGEPHVIRRGDGRVFGDIVALEVTPG